MLLEYIDMNKHSAHCDIARQGNVVVAKERNDNPGMSVTNACAEIAAKVCEQFHIAPAELILYELYMLCDGTANISRITFSDPERYSGCSWSPSTVDAFEAEFFPIQALCSSLSY